MVDIDGDGRCDEMIKEEPKKPKEEFKMPKWGWYIILGSIFIIATVLSLFYFFRWYNKKYYEGFKLPENVVNNPTSNFQL
jgi:hypothetical protein